MFSSIVFCGDGCCDYHGAGIYNTFVFMNGQCLEWNDDFLIIQKLKKGLDL